MELTRRRFIGRVGSIAAVVLTGAWRVLDRVVPDRWTAVRSRCFPGRICHRDEKAAAGPAGWAG